MISEAPPIFVPSGPGFKASYSLTFSSDTDHCIHLFGSLQGDAVSAKTLVVDNGSNSAGCTVTLRGKTVPVPGFAIAYVDCEGELDAVISSNVATAKISVDVLTYSKTEQIISKKTLNVAGLPPVSVKKSGTVDNRTAIKVLSIGDPVMSFVNLTCPGAASSIEGVTCGFSSDNFFAQVYEGSSYNINISCENNELWLKAFNTNTTQLLYVNYEISAG
jgi:hypothetical protein